LNNDHCYHNGVQNTTAIANNQNGQLYNCEYYRNGKLNRCGGKANTVAITEREQEKIGTITAVLDSADVALGGGIETMRTTVLSPLRQPRNLRISST
jgi:hypothetical protein